MDNLVINLAAVRNPDTPFEEFDRTIRSMRAIAFDLVDKGPPPNVEVMWGTVWKPFEREFEDWLANDLSVLAAYGWQLHLLSRQWRAPDGSVADLLCRSTDDSSNAAVGDLIVIENKAVEATESSIEQLALYVAHVGRERTDVAAHGILLAPGLGDAARAAPDRQGFETSTWGDVGFLDYLWHSDLPHDTIRQAVS